MPASHANAAVRIDAAYAARLAQMDLTPGETRQFQVQLQQILDHIRDLQQLDLDGIEPTAHAAPVRNVWRPDEPRPGLERERALANAPEHDGQHFLAPQII